MISTDFTLQKAIEYICFLQHPEKKDHYLIVQDTEHRINKYMDMFFRRGKYEGMNLAFSDIHFILVDKILCPDEKLFGFCYYLQHEIEAIKYKKDEHFPYGDWGWYILQGELLTNKWLQDYLTMEARQKAENKQKELKASDGRQISMF